MTDYSKRQLKALDRISKKIQYLIVVTVLHNMKRLRILNLF